MNIRHFHELREKYALDIFNECLDKRDYACLKKFLELSNNGGDYGGIKPVYSRDTVDMLLEENIMEPANWLQYMVDMNILQRTSVVDNSKFPVQGVAAYLVNPAAREFVNLRYFKEHNL